jgi:diguanylate cyclase (GGDEF)-like protein
MDEHSTGGPDALAGRSLWRHARDLVIDAARDGTVRAASPATVQWLGGQVALLDLVHPQDASRLVELLTGEPPERPDFRFANVPPEPGWRTVEVTATTPTAHGTVVVARDVTRERQALATLDAHRDVLASLAGGAPLPAVLDGLARSIEAASSGARVIALVTRGIDLELAAAPSLRADAAGAFARLRGAGDRDAFPAPGPLTGTLADAATEHGLGFGWAAPVLDRDSPVALLVLFPGAKRFPSAHEQAALAAAMPLAQVAVATARLRTDVHDAVRLDPLTGVLGRPAFLAELTQLARRSRDVLGLLLVQVDGVAAVNEAHGLAAGDAVLREVATRLATTVRGRDLLGRCGGTRFAVAGAALGRDAASGQLAQRVRDVLGTPFVVGGIEVPVPVRLATTTRHGRVGDPETLLRAAQSQIGSGPGETPRRSARPAAAAAPGAGSEADVTNETPARRRRDRRSGAAGTDR